MVGGSVHAGGIEVVSLVDAVGAFGTYPELFPEATEEDWSPWRERHPDLFDGERWRLPFRSFLVRAPGRTILVDTGVGPPGEGEFLPERQGWLPGELERLGVEVDIVFLTHVHVDHVGWNAAFPGARFVAHRESVALAVERGHPLPEGTEAVVGETELTPGVVAFETPGHLPGHMSVLVGDSLVVLADVAVHPAQLARPALVYVSDADPALCAETREHVLAAYGDLTLACGHYPAAGFGRVENGVWSPVG